MRHWIVSDACLAVNADFCEFQPSFPELMHSFSADTKRAAQLRGPEAKN
jgi:hypothetical protein